jgi:hypothetical protein
MGHLFSLFGLATYLALAPIYWLPGVSPEVLRATKLILFVAAVALVWLYRSRKALSFATSSFLGIPSLILVLIASSVGFAMAAPGEAGTTLLSFAVVYISLWTFYGASDRPAELAKVLFWSAVGIAVACVPTVTSFFFQFPIWLPPSEFRTDALHTAGLGAARTGWSNGIALYLPIILLPLLMGTKVVSPLGIASICGAIAIVASQYVSGGRAGLIASLSAIVVMALVSGRKRVLLACALLGPFLITIEPIIAARDMSGAMSHLRIDRLAHANSTDALNQFSAGRLDLAEQALEQWQEEPFGVGFGNAFFSVANPYEGYDTAEVHNLWLKLTVESGPFLPIIFLITVILVLRAPLRSVFRLNRLKATVHFHPFREIYGAQVVYLAIIIQGVLISLVEPNALIGSFQATAIWWAAAGAGVRNEKLVPMR